MKACFASKRSSTSHERTRRARHRRFPGIGRAIALALARAGCDIAIHYRERDAEHAGLAADVTAAGSPRTRCPGRRLARRRSRPHGRGSGEQLGGIDILVNNAGIPRPQSIEEITEQDWDEMLAVNLKSCFLVTQAVLPGMRARRWGRIINLSSVAAQTGGVVGPHYAASKAGMLGLTHSYAARLAKEGITVNAIAPALIETEMVTANPNARPTSSRWAASAPSKRVADIAVMLAGNGYITGQTINVNGGWYMS